MSDSADSFHGSVLYISHGGGPLPLLGDPAHGELINNLKELATIVPRPSAILVISAHWEQDKPTITAGRNPSLIYDYYGFPRESYEIQYPAAGEPVLAEEIFELLKKDGMEAILDEDRGFDHGLFVPLKLMYPEANIPCVQLSLLRGLNPAEHIRMGRALSALKEEGVTVVGSGFSFHNLRAFFSPSTDETGSMNEAFEHWLVETCSSHGFTEDERERRLVQWESAPAARYCHPREEHFLPLHVCYGLVGSPSKQFFTFEVMGKKASAYLW